MFTKLEKSIVWAVTALTAGAILITIAFLCVWYFANYEKVPTSHQDVATLGRASEAEMKQARETWATYWREAWFVEGSPYNGSGLTVSSFIAEKYGKITWVYYFSEESSAGLLVMFRKGNIRGDLGRLGIDQVLFIGRDKVAILYDVNSDKHEIVQVPVSF